MVSATTSGSTLGGPPGAGSTTGRCSPCPGASNSPSRDLRSVSGRLSISRVVPKMPHARTWCTARSCPGYPGCPLPRPPRCRRWSRLGWCRCSTRRCRNRVYPRSKAARTLSAAVPLPQGCCRRRGSGPCSPAPPRRSSCRSFPKVLYFMCGSSFAVSRPLSYRPRVIGDGAVAVVQGRLRRAPGPG